MEEKDDLKLSRGAELLSPAGDPESLAAAIRYGADAVYLGGEFLQLRAGRTAFSREGLVQAAEYVHENGKKLYVTVNSFAKTRELAEAGDYAKYLYDIGADGAIISDIGLLDVFAKAAPDLPRHLSTQASCMNAAAAKVYYDMGVSRIVLARELSINDIAELRGEAPEGLELEAFVHGAMCMAVSGRCLISSYLAGRSGNRGECAQPCRWSYALTEEKRPGEYFPIVEDGGYSAILSSHDLCAVELLDELYNAGVRSFKIEGRMKTAYYTATVTNAYRMALSGFDTALCLRELEAVRHRPYSTGFYLGELGAGHFNGGEYIRRCVFIGNVLSYGGGILKVRQRNRFAVGDTVEALRPGKPPLRFTVEEIKTEDGETRDAAPHPNETLYIPCPEELSEGDFLRRWEEPNE